MHYRGHKAHILADEIDKAEYDMGFLSLTQDAQAAANSWL